MIKWNIDRLPEVDRPREKLRLKGAEALSDAELISVILGSGVRGHGVLRVAGDVLRILVSRCGEPTLEELKVVPGVGEARAAQLVAGLELSRRFFVKGRPRISSAEDVLPHVRDIAMKKQEYFVCISLNGAHEVIERRTVTVGLLDSNQVHPREVFADPIADRAAAVIFAHNHPSGTLEASPEDIALTERLCRAGHLLGIRVLDHLIVTRDGFTSLHALGHVKVGSRGCYDDVECGD
ncbi:DNA repair protein RadC [Candidatus Bipolaricaulota bacterium]|nr:DNA repair protein RadC [Candidatus Bipolaricaulota bacterium]